MDKRRGGLGSCHHAVFEGFAKQSCLVEEKSLKGTVCIEERGPDWEKKRERKDWRRVETDFS